MTVSNSTPDGVVSMAQVTGSLLNEETRRKGSSHSEALVVKPRGRGRSRIRHDRDPSRNKSREKSSSNKDIEGAT